MALAVAPAAIAQPAAPPTQAVSQAQVYEPAYFARFAPKTAADMVSNIPGFSVNGDNEDQNERGFGQAKQNVLINGRRVSGKSNDAQTALGRISAESVVRIEVVDGATLNIPGLSGQVANVIAHVDAFSGNWEVVPEFRENLQPSWYRGSVSANGKTEDGWSWSASLDLAEFHNGSDGIGIIRDGSGNLLDLRREGFNGAGEEPNLAATLTYDAKDGAIANMNLSLRSLNFVGREDSFRNPVNSDPLYRYTAIGEDELGGELGADYEFDFGPGRLKLIALHRYEEGDDLVTIESYDDGGAYIADTGQRLIEHAEEGESIVRGEYGFAAFGGDMQVAAEGAFNFLDVATDFGERALDGSYDLAVLPGGTARVEERRAETNLSYSRKLSDAWSLQSSIGVEYSELSQKGAGGLTREFVRPKGFLALVWKVDDTLDVSFKAERKVGQLDFGDFLSSVDIQNNNAFTGNVELVPDQSWILSSEVNKTLGPWGAVKLAGEYHRIEDVVDLVPIGAQGQQVSNIADIRGEGVGNIDEAWASSITASGTIKFDPIGAKGVQAEFSWRYRNSELDDPLTGEARQIGNYPKITANVALRWDIPGTPWTLTGGLEEYQNYAFYRLSEVSRQWNAPSVNFFSIENKDVFGMKVRLQAVNLNDTSENFKREVYQSADPNDPDSPRLRTNPLAFTDEQYRTFGPIVRLFVSGSF
ncbi:MAG TPA: TonB-dependent receptor plug domain-containing protein [Hyphomonadaceae bacterium]|nr:TonB-dependent receptor plug domain-containing protein [Hyphomonadaceae bacterium]